MNAVIAQSILYFGIFSLSLSFDILYTAEISLFYMRFPQRIGDFLPICCGNVGFLCEISAENGCGESKNCKFLLDIVF